MADPKTTATSPAIIPMCLNCRWWQVRLGGVGWCDLRYPQEMRGIRKNVDTCDELERK